MIFRLVRRFVKKSPNVPDSDMSNIGLLAGVMFILSVLVCVFVPYSIPKFWAILIFQTILLIAPLYWMPKARGELFGRLMIWILCFGAFLCIFFAMQKGGGLSMYKDIPYLLSLNFKQEEGILTDLSYSELHYREYIQTCYFQINGHQFYAYGGEFELDEFKRYTIAYLPNSEFVIDVVETENDKSSINRDKEKKVERQNETKSGETDTSGQISITRTTDQDSITIYNHSESHSESFETGEIDEELQKKIDAVFDEFEKLENSPENN